MMKTKNKKKMKENKTQNSMEPLEGQGGHPFQEVPNQPGTGLDSPANYQAKTTDPSSTGGAEAHVSPVTRSFQEMKVSEEPEKTEDSPTGSHDQFSPTIPPSEPTPIQSKPEPAPEHPQSYTDKITSAASTVYEAVAGKTVQGPEEGKGKEDKGVSVRDYLVGKLSPGEEDKALSEVISDDKVRSTMKTLRGGGFRSLATDVTLLSSGRSSYENSKLST
ncbi:Low-temperature-induced 65 kDa protein [Acorus calamus]|uniref:Low-temperature-induced 65 kDa protein n=1 Tax=Acorus calamus TaxID=4465 RepID=A0AAV9E5L8_ACOCL|nr:Low-temperature-induced 65 kDa protein [Acorus calamus]